LPFGCRRSLPPTSLPRTNFPIVRLTNDATGQVFYARTFHWTQAVATGGAPVTAQFSVPAGLPQAIYSLRVVANRIASAPVPFDTIQGLHVFTTTPANGSVVSTRPTSFVVNFNEAIVPATLQATDLTVNGRAANRVSLDPTNQIATFTFTSSPVTAQGVQSMAIVANSITGVDTTGILPFAASFRYDVVTLAVWCFFLPL
jgi:methionine-rich copper-binding protein CopC